MRAAILKALGAPLSVEELPDLEPVHGGVVVDVVASGVLGYAGEVFRGERDYLFDLPLTPGTGAVGRIRAVGPDVTRLQPGEWVWCDPTVRSRDGRPEPDIMLQGLSARGEEGLRLQRFAGQGAWAEQVLMPSENVFPLGDLDPAAAARWTAINVGLVPYGGLLAAGLQAGETVAVSGATGHFGSAGVAVALAMGAARVIAPGRNEAALADLRRRFGGRVRTVRLTGVEATDRESLVAAAAPSAIDLVLDLLPPRTPTGAVRAAAMSVREHGRVVLMGGIRDDLALPYGWLMRYGVTVRGQWMFPPDANARLIALARAGALDLDQWTISEFPLDRVTEAMAHAAAHAGAFQLTVVRP